MALTIFLVLNGLAVLFLLYVLVNLWKEGHRQRHYLRLPAIEFLTRDRVDVAVITNPIVSAAQGVVSVIPFPVAARELWEKPARGRTSVQALAGDPGFQGMKEVIPYPTLID